MASPTDKWRNITLYGNPEFCRRVKSNLDAIFMTFIGGYVLRQVLSNVGKISNFVDIQFAQDNFGYRKKGMGALLAIDFNKLKKITDPTSQKVLAKNMEFVYLHHELVHTFRAQRGEYKGDTNGSTPEEEWSATGLYEYADYHISENKLRADLGLPRRPYYYTPELNPDYAKEEVKRRMLLKLPDTPGYRAEEEVFAPNKYNRTLTKDEITQYLGLGLVDESGTRRRFKDERAKFPKGFPVRDDEERLMTFRKETKDATRKGGA